MASSVLSVIVCISAIAQSRTDSGVSRVTLLSTSPIFNLENANLLLISFSSLFSLTVARKTSNKEPFFNHSLYLVGFLAEHTTHLGLLFEFEHNEL